MKKVSFMKLNLQQENLLSKEEKKEVLRGAGPVPCYVVCNNGNRIGIDRCDDYAIRNNCGESSYRSCSCNY